MRMNLIISITTSSLKVDEADIMEISLLPLSRAFVKFRTLLPFDIVSCKGTRYKLDNEMGKYHCVRRPDNYLFSQEQIKDYVTKYLNYILPNGTFSLICFNQPYVEANLKKLLGEDYFAERFDYHGIDILSLFNFFKSDKNKVNSFEALSVRVKMFHETNRDKCYLMSEALNMFSSLKVRDLHDK